MAQIGVVPDDIRAPDIDETPNRQERPRPYCIRMAHEKALAVTAAADELVLSADTTVALGRRILGKPEGETEARAFLAMLSGRRHQVITAMTVRLGEKLWHRNVMSAVKMKSLSAAEIDGYIMTQDWRGKAGGYGIQGPASAFIPWISGSHSAIVGLPLAETSTLLQAAGYPIWKDAR